MGKPKTGSVDRRLFEAQKFITLLAAHVADKDLKDLIKKHGQFQTLVESRAPEPRWHQFQWILEFYRGSCKRLALNWIMFLCILIINVMGYLFFEPGKDMFFKIQNLCDLFLFRNFY